MNDTAAALRQVADLLDAHPDLPEPYITTDTDYRVTWFLNHHTHTEQRTQAARIIAALGGHWGKGEADWNTDRYEFTQARGLMALTIVVHRHVGLSPAVTA